MFCFSACAVWLPSQRTFPHLPGGRQWGTPSFLSCSFFQLQNVPVWSFPSCSVQPVLCLTSCTNEVNRTQFSFSREKPADISFCCSLHRQVQISYGFAGRGRKLAAGEIARSKSFCKSCSAAKEWGPTAAFCRWRLLILRRPTDSHNGSSTLRAVSLCALTFVSDTNGGGHLSSGL